MNLQTLLAILNQFLPAIETGVSFFVHKPSSQDKFSFIAGEVNNVAAIALQLATPVAAPKP